MLDTFLVSGPIVVKGFVVVVDDNPGILLQESPSDPFMALFLSSDIQRHMS